MDKHTLALISIIGNSFDVLGALYLAYDLLGGEHGPLRTLTRAVTYGTLFGSGYGLALGPVSAWRAAWRMALPSPGNFLVCRGTVRSRDSGWTRP